MANDLRMGDGAPRLFVLTGPNMGGKSTFLRQTALMVLLAQMGSFVPAREAKIGIVDRIFTRVGRDRPDPARASRPSWWRCRRRPTSCAMPRARSLVLLDEIGRGTATFDGLSIAWAVAEHIARDAEASARPSSPRTTTS